MATLRDFLGDFRKEEELLSRFESPEQALSAIMSARGENPGELRDDRLEGLDPAALGVLDRLASARVSRRKSGFVPAALAGAFGVAPYEAAKALGAERLIKGATRLLHPAATEEYGFGETTSPASLRNVGAYVQGLSLGDMLR